MKKKQTAPLRREKSCSCNPKAKKERAKDQCMSEVYGPMSDHEEMEECERGRRKKNTFTLCTPCMNSRCQLTLHTRRHHPLNTPHVCKKKCDRSKSSSRTFENANPMKSGCTSPIKSKSDSRGLSFPLYGSNNWTSTHPNTSYHWDDGRASAFTSGMQRQQSYMKSGDHQGERPNAFPVNVSKPWAYSSTKTPSIASSLPPKYEPALFTRSLAAIMAEYAQPKTKMDSATESILNTFSNGVTSKSQNYYNNMSKNFTHNSSSYMTKPTAFKECDSKSSPAFTFSVPRPISANSYHTGSTKFGDNKDDMSTISFNAVRNDCTSRGGSTYLGSKPSSERKSLASKFGLSDNVYGSDNIESILKSGRASANATKSTYHDTSNISQQGLPSYRRKYDSFLNTSTTYKDMRHDYLPKRSNIGGMSQDYEFRSRLSDTSFNDCFTNKTLNPFVYEDFKSQMPLSNHFSGFIGNHWQSEKDRLNKITNIIGKSTVSSSKRE